MSGVGYVPENDIENDRFDISDWRDSYPWRYDMMVDPRDRRALLRPRKQPLRLRLTTRLPRINLRRGLS